MEIRARNTSGSYITVGKVRWSEEWSGWQFAAIPIVMPEAYQAVQINIIYRNNLNEAQFSNLFLHKEEFGKTFAYDSNGSVTSVRNMASLQSYGAYDSFNNLLACRQPGRPSTAQYTQAWGDTDAERKKHLLRTAQSPTGVIRAYTYDAKGNVLTGTTRNAAGTLTIASSAAYTADGNYVSSQTDARGKTVTIVTDANNGAVASVTDPNGQSVAYTYDGLNRRTASTASADGKTYRNTYTYTGDLLTRISHNTTADDACDVNYHFAYDAQNRPAIVAYNGTKYAYIYNLQGDVLGLIDSNGTEVVKYTYDAWGKVLSATGFLASTMGIVQPFRYRGYVYDVETGLYYLRSRYYNPGWQRFVNADTLIKGNLYTYCKNNSLLWRDNLGTDEVKSESTGDITNFIREGFRCTVFVENPTFPTNSGYMQTITAVFYIPYQDIQYYNNALYFETKNPIDVAIESAVWKIESKANDMIIDTIGKYLWSKAHYFGYLMDAIGVAEDYINAAAEAALKEQHQVAQQKATDSQSGMIVKMTYMRRWFYVYSIAGSRMGTYWEADPIISYQYYESSDPSISNYYSLLMQ